MTRTGRKSVSTLEYPAFKASWIDILLAWVDRLPGPNWPYYLLGIVVVGVLANAAFWIDGTLRFGSMNLPNTLFGVLVFLWLALYHYLTRVGSRALSRFRPLLALGDSEVADIEYALGHLPRGQGWAALVAGLVWTLTSLVGEPTEYGGLVPNGPLPFVLDVLITGFLASSFLCLLLRSIRQLRMVDRLQRQAVNVDLLNLKPAQAFSMLTSRTAIGVLGLLVLAYLYDPFRTLTTLDVFWYTLTVVLAAAIFALPIMALRGRLEEEKLRALNATSYHLQLARDMLHAKLRGKDLTDLKEVEAGMASLRRDLELYRRAATWPWDPDAIRAFASALLLPIVLWLITRLLERFF